MRAVMSTTTHPLTKIFIGRFPFNFVVQIALEKSFILTITSTQYYYCTNHSFLCLFGCVCASLTNPMDPMN